MWFELFVNFKLFFFLSSHLLINHILCKDMCTRESVNKSVSQSAL